MSLGTLNVGRRKKIPKKGAAKPKTIGYLVSGEYGEWQERLARHYRTTLAGVIDRAIGEWAESEGYSEKPPERMP